MCGQSDNVCNVELVKPCAEKAGEDKACHKDFLDIYIDVASTHPRNEDEVRFLAYLQEAQGFKTTTPFSALLFSSMLARSRLLGRFCGLQRDEGVSKLPQRFVSLYREVILDFFAAPSMKRISGRDKLGFNGTFKIITDGKFTSSCKVFRLINILKYLFFTDIYYPGQVASPQDIPFLPHEFLRSASKGEEKENKVGAPEPTCRFVIQSKSEQQSGEFASPAYPGFHPPGLQCIYTFRGQPNQRIKVTILDLNLPSQMNTCSTDYIQFFDGNDLNRAPSIGNRICGEHENLEIYSTESFLTIIFVTYSTISENTFTRYRGFRIAYKFWDKFVPVESYFKEHHVRGTECDFAIQSERNGLNGMQKDELLESPSFSFSAVLYPSHVCTFYFLGRHEKQRLETVRVGFDFVDLPPFNRNEKKCSNGFLAVYGSRVENTDNFTLRSISSSSFTDLNLLEGNLAAPYSIASLPQPSQIWCGDKLDAIKTKDDVDSSAIISLRSALALRFNASGQSYMNVRFRI
ncbi:unnamed protein product [Hymenolepis diminuta]|uniref:CUB domain-containing protein n=1 Tax=Hymenolepis diminuta TaxID=6216 RepID=A0A0R3SIC2_HYMDI|nr:unnamed protein product [Hymenolepis diminuta]